MQNRPVTKSRICRNTVKWGNALLHRLALMSQTHLHAQLTQSRYSTAWPTAPHPLITPQSAVRSPVRTTALFDHNSDWIVSGARWLHNDGEDSGEGILANTRNVRGATKEHKNNPSCSLWLALKSPPISCVRQKPAHPVREDTRWLSWVTHTVSHTRLKIYW